MREEDSIPFKDTPSLLLITTQYALGLSIRADINYTLRQVNNTSLQGCKRDKSVILFWKYTGLNLGC